MLKTPLAQYRHLASPSHCGEKIEQLIISQQGSDTLILSDLELHSPEAVSIVTALIPQYHATIHHMILSGSKISGEGFQLIFSALLHCTHLQSIIAECNNLADSAVGLEALLNLIQSLHNIELIDLQNNGLDQQSAKVIAEILRLNKFKLKVLDLRWNEIGESGAQHLINSLPENQYVQFIGLEDNRISTGTLLRIEGILKRQSRLRGAKRANQQFIHDESQTIPPPTESPSLETNFKTEKLRSKILNEQQFLEAQISIIQSSCAGVIQKIRQKAPQIQELQTNHALLVDSNATALSHLRQAQIALGSFQEQSAFLRKELDRELNYRKSLRVKVNDQIRELHQKVGFRNSEALSSLSTGMEQKMESLTKLLKCKLEEKQRNRQVLSQLKQEILKIKIGKEELWNRSAVCPHRYICESGFPVLEERIAEAKAQLANQIKQAGNSIRRNRNFVTTCFQKEDNLLKAINQTEHQIKSYHFNMTRLNLQTQSRLSNASLLDSKKVTYAAAIDSLKDFTQYLDKEGCIWVEVERHRQRELDKEGAINADNIEERIQEIERAVRMQNTQNKLIKQKYQQMRGACENLVKTHIHQSIFEDKEV